MTETDGIESHMRLVFSDVIFFNVFSLFLRYRLDKQEFYAIVMGTLKLAYGYFVSLAVGSAVAVCKALSTNGYEEICPMAKSPAIKKSYNPLDELHGYDRQFYLVKQLPRLEQSDTLAKLKILASLTEGSPEWTELRNEIVLGNLYFAYTIGNEYAVRFKKIADDCIQYASVGLIKAVEDYCRNGNGSSFLPYAKTTIARVVRRKGIAPSVKCGITHSRDVSNTAHNAEVDAKRQEKGRSAIEAVSVIADEQKDEDGNSVNVLDAMPSDCKDAFAELADRELQEAYETAVNTLLDAQDANIWRLRMQGLDWVSIAQQVGLKRNATQMRFYSAKKRVEGYLASVK